MGNEVKVSKLNESTGKLLAVAGVVLGVLGFFWQPVIMGIVAIVLGALALLSPQKIYGWIAVATGVVALIGGIY